MAYESVILILFLIASFVAVIAKRVNLPYTIALVAVGLLLGTIHILNPPHLTQELLYAIFLPPLIFEAAIHLSFDELKKDFWPITMLVVPGVIISTLATAAVMITISAVFTQIELFTWPVGILFGAAVAATDPVSVVALFKRLGAPKRLTTLIESESLLNDGTSIVVFILAMQFLQGAISAVEMVSIEFVKIVGLGLLVGFIIGVVLAQFITSIDDAMVVITLTTVAAYSSFLLADHLGVSGVMSTVATGLVMREKGLTRTILPSIRLTTETFWEYIAFAMNSLIFLLMGFTINLSYLWKLWPIILLAYLAVLIARIVVVGSTWLIFLPTRWHFPFSWAVVLSWGGLRGALSMVLALSIPDSFAFKDLVVTLVFGVVLLSIFVQGLSMPLLLKLLHLISPLSELKSYELLKTEVNLIQESLEMIDSMVHKRYISKKSAQKLKEEFVKQLQELNKMLDELQPDMEILITEETLRTKRRIIMEQKRKLLDMYQHGSISFEVYDTIKKELDEKLFELENMGI